MTIPRGGPCSQAGFGQWSSPTEPSYPPTPAFCETGLVQMAWRCLGTRTSLVSQSDPMGKVRGENSPSSTRISASEPSNHPPKACHHGFPCKAVWEPLCLHHSPREALSHIFLNLLIIFLPKKNQPAWEAEIIQYHQLQPASAGGSEVQDGDQTGAFRKIITLERVNVSLVMDLSSARRKEVGTHMAVPCSKAVGEVNSLQT